MTLSGGEATAQTDFFRALAEELYDRGISLWLETCGCFSFDEAADVLRKMDHIFFDLKLMDSRAHREYTGVGNETILENAKRVYGLGIPMTVRVPCIPGVNLTEENLRATAAFVTDFLPEADLELLPYHAYGVSKYKALRFSGGAEFRVPEAGEMAWAAGLLSSLGVTLTEYK